MRQCIFVGVLLIINLMVSFATNAQDYDKSYEEQILTDPISKTEIKIPYGVINDSSSIKFKKYFVETPKTYISLFSVENPNACQYTWEKIIEFEKERDLGKLIEQDRLPAPADGWIHIFKSRSKAGYDYYTALTLVRGNAYALYLLEDANKQDDLITPGIAKTTEFRPITGKRINNDGQTTWRTWVTILAIILIGFLVRLLGKNMSAGLKYFLIVVSSGCYFGGSYFFVKFPLGITICFTITLGVLLWLVLFSKNWEDFFNKLEKILPKD